MQTSNFLPDKWQAAERAACSTGRAVRRASIRAPRQRGWRSTRRRASCWGQQRPARRHARAGDRERAERGLRRRPGHQRPAVSLSGAEARAASSARPGTCGGIRRWSCAAGSACSTTGRKSARCYDSVKNPPFSQQTTMRYGHSADAECRVWRRARRRRCGRSQYRSALAHFDAVERRRADRGAVLDGRSTSRIRGSTARTAQRR